MRALLALVTCLGLAGCGGRGAIFLTIEARGPAGTLRIPEEVDELKVTVQNPSGATVLLAKDYPLTRDVQFPLTLALEQGGKTNNKVQISVVALLAGQSVGSTESNLPFNPEEVTNVTLRIEQQ